MENKIKTFAIRVRAIIIHRDKLLVVRHAHNPTYAALPGGHLDFGEDPHECLSRELVEELGVLPVIGRLLYVNTFTTERNGEKVQPLELFFLIENGADYTTLAKEGRSHAHELAEVAWVGKSDEIPLLPTQLASDLAEGNLVAEGVRFIKN